jgi:hypothetical protein
MPREQINYPDLCKKDEQKARVNGVNDPPSEFEPWNDSSLHIGWLNAEETARADYPGIGWVQIGFEADLEYLRFAQSSPNGARPDRTIMWTAPVSPGELDRLIGVLKRARRKAFTPVQ